MTHSLNSLFRQDQFELMQYKSGCVAVQAVPGSGKTWLLAQLASAQVTKLSQRDIDSGREILVVTFSNSAAAALNKQIRKTLSSEYQRPLEAGIRVRTLHALALDIISESPSAFGLENDFRIIEERLAYHIRRDAVLNNLPRHPQLEHLMDPAVITQPNRIEVIKSEAWPNLLYRVAERFIQNCKNQWLTPGDHRLKFWSQQTPLINFLLDTYRDYQQSLQEENAVDYDDLVVLVCAALRQDEKLLRKLQNRWRICLEDEAQDSSSSQAVMLRLLTGGKNWVRVGDPNQAINTTFTTADPASLQRFRDEDGVRTLYLAESGRSARPIIALANTLMKWTRNYHPNKALRSTFTEQQILPTEPGDPDPTPSTNDSNIHIHLTKQRDITPDQAQQIVMASLLRWLPHHAKNTVAILVPENRQGYAICSALEMAGVLHDERLQMPTQARRTLSALNAILHYLAAPLDSEKLASMYRLAWSHIALTETLGQTRVISQRLARFRDLETLLYPPDEQADPLETFFASLGSSVCNEIQRFRSVIQGWLMMSHLPVELQIWQIAETIFPQDNDRVVIEEIARFVHAYQRRHPHADLQDVLSELDVIAVNNSRFFRATDSEPFQPRPGIPTVSTIHAAKGLEWDRVYVLGINNRAFPSAMEEDTFVSDRWFVRNQFNLEAEAQQVIRCAVEGSAYIEGEATQQAHLDFAAERLRLLYVGITRARQELVLLWDIGWNYRAGTRIAAPAVPLIALHEYLEGTLHLG